MPVPSPHNWLFGSFFIGGFECSNHVTQDGRRLDLVAATGHDLQAAEDYALCRSVGIRAVREAVRWPLADRAGALTLGEPHHLARLGNQASLTQIWDLMHYGYPDDLDPLADPDRFVDRFACYARAAATAIVQEATYPVKRYYTPINEISYFTWAAAGVGYMAPFGKDRGDELKRTLVRVAIAGMNAIWEADPEAVMVTVDPLVRLHPPPERPDLQSDADFFNHVIVTQAFDMLCGRVCPELGGSRRHLGIPGFNYYACNQWTIPTPEYPQNFIGMDDPRWIPLVDLLAEMQERYGGPLLLAETGDSGVDRPPWIAYLAEQARLCTERGVDLAGVCLYPAVTSPDWEDPTAFFEGGIFDVSPQPDGTLARYLPADLASALRAVQADLDPANLPDDRPLGSAQGKLTTDDPSYSALSTQHSALYRPLDHARFKPDNFSYQVLHAGDQLLIELICLEPGGILPPHRHESTEHVWTVLQGTAEAKFAYEPTTIQAGDTIFIPANAHHELTNTSTLRLVIQQISAPKPWDARFQAPHPTSDQ